MTQANQSWAQYCRLCPCVCVCVCNWLSWTLDVLHFKVTLLSPNDLGREADPSLIKQLQLPAFSASLEDVR